MPYLRCSIALLAVSAFAGPPKVSFNRDIRPIMADTCFRCHGPDKSSRMAGLRLDLRDEALKTTKSGITPIVPGKPEESAIIARIFATSPAKLMPPKFAHKDLTTAQKETIRRWVAEGAEYQGHWAYVPVERPAVPPGAEHPVDAFIRARLAAEGLQPSPEASRRVLIRRVSTDLTGLPPALDEIQAFVNDKSPDAYEKLVDRLLASPRYAEKQAMHWLDAVRYADTCGFHGDNAFPAWPYRDYVLRSFLNNKPFDQFTREQLAGDLLPDATLEQRVASAYNRLNRTSAEGGLQPKEYLAKYGADRVRTVSNVWLGSTMGCAECHDHKFDPFTARDFYSMKAFFADIKETGLVPDRGEKAWGAQLPLPNEAQQNRLEELTRLIKEAEERLSAEPVTDEWERATYAAWKAGKLSWRVQRPVTTSSAQGATLTVYNEQPVPSSYDYRGSVVSEERPGNGLVVVSGKNPDNETYTITIHPGPGVWTALGIEGVQDESLPGVKIARGADRFVLTEVTASAAGKPLLFSLATSSLNFPTPEHPAMATIDGKPATGWGMIIHGERENPFLALRFADKLTTDASTVLTVQLHFDSEYRRATLGRFKIALSAAEHSWPGRGAVGVRESKDKQNGISAAALKAMQAWSMGRTDKQLDALREYKQWVAGETVELERLRAERDQLEAAIPRVVVSEATQPGLTRVLGRGNWMDDSGEIVDPAIPGFLGQLPADGRATRLDLANWIVSRKNPLTSRVFVNRLWREFFGAGLTRVLDDFGSQGELPSHPELLDWLAAEFMDSGWDVKHIIRTIVTSHAYRQSSEATPAMKAKDPGNRLIAHQGSFRVEAETVRDIALSASGLLTEKFGGPSVRPYQPEGYLAALNFPKRDYSASRAPDLYRRGVYIHWQRTFLYPQLTTFDAPSREECAINRPTSNTPLQALVLLNDPVFVEAARVFAERALLDGGVTSDRRIAWAFARATGRTPTAYELAKLKALYMRSLQSFRAKPASAKELLAIGDAPVSPKLKPETLAAMATVTRAILNLHETIHRN